MDINLINKDVIKNSKRADEIHFFEVEVKNMNDVDNEFATKFIRDIVNFNCRLEFTEETWEDVKMLIEDKLNKINEYPMGFLKNDGTVMPLIANYILEKVFNIVLLSYSEDLTDLEMAPKGFDSISFDENYDLFLCEYKSSITKENLNEDRISNIFIEGYKSIFCKNSNVISKISSIKSRLSKSNVDEKNILIKKLKKLAENRRKLELLLEDKDEIKFNICCIGKSKNELNFETIVKGIDEKFVSSAYCREKGDKYCSKYENCDKCGKLKVTNIIIIKIPKEFNIKNFYINILKIIEEKKYGS